MSRRGSTLIELLVAMAVLAIALGVATVAFRPEPEPDAAARTQAVLARARADAIRTGHPVPLDSLGAIAYPDGRVLATDGRLIEPMSGRPHAR